MKAYSTAVATALDAGAVRPVMFLQFDFDSGTQRYTTAGHNIDWESHTWYAVTAPVEIGEVRETESLEAVGVPIVLRGLPTSVVSIVLQEQIQGRAVTAWVGVVADDGTIYCDVNTDIEFAGRCDAPSIQIDAGTAAIRITVENRMAQWARASGRRYTDADQQKSYSGDRFFEYVPQMVEKTLVFPGKEFFL